MNAIREWMDKPLSTTEIIIILAVLVFLLFLIIQIDKWRTHQKSKKFIRQRPDAALILLAAEDRPVSRAVLNVLEGEASSPFPVPASQRPDGKRGLAFYAAPGPVSVNLMLSHAKDSDGRSSTANRLRQTLPIWLFWTIWAIFAFLCSKGTTLIFKPRRSLPSPKRNRSTPTPTHSPVSRTRS